MKFEKDTLIKILDCCIEDNCFHCPNAYKDSSIAACEAVARGSVHIPFAIMRETIEALKEQEHLKLKMWNALYAEEDKLEKKFIGTEKHDDWFNVYRPWLQSGFEIAITVIAEQDGM